MAKAKKQITLPGGASAPPRFVTRQTQAPRTLYYDAKGKFTTKEKAVSRKLVEKAPIYRDKEGKKITEAEARAKKVKIVNIDKDGKLTAKPVKKLKAEPLIDSKTEPTRQQMFNTQVNKLVEDSAGSLFNVYALRKGSYFQIKGNALLNWTNFSWEIWRTYVNYFRKYLDSPQLLFNVNTGNIGAVIELDTIIDIPDLAPKQMKSPDFLTTLRAWRTKKGQIISKYFKK